MLVLEKIKLEFMGTFLSIFLSGLGIMQFAVGATDLISTSTCIFCAICISLWMGKSISGGEFNPLITICLYMTKHHLIDDAIFKIIAQFFGALFACSLIYTITPTEVIDSISENTILGIPSSVETPIFHIFFAELLGSFFIVLFYYVLIVDVKSEKHVYAPAIGAIHFIISVRFLTVSGAILNLARLVGYMVTAGNYNRWWVYILALPVGSVAGAFLGNYLIPKVRRVDDTDLMSEIASVSDDLGRELN
jgi:glycerol uptake facilitator-like aquaporin